MLYINNISKGRSLCKLTIPQMEEILERWIIHRLRLYLMAGFFGQRLHFGHKTKNYSDKLRVDEDKCIGCGKCEKLCPMNNIKVVDKKVVQNNQCTMCYRCINNCPKQAMTLLGKKVVEQSVIEKYL